MKLLISGADYSSLVAPMTLRISDKVNQRSTGNIRLVDKTGTSFHPDPGEPVEIYDNSGALVYAGVIHNPQQNLYIGSPAVDMPVDFVDNQALADRHLVAETYDNWTVGDITKDLITKYLAAEGVVAGNIMTGPTLTRAVFPYVTATDAFNSLAQQGGYNWVITADKQLHMGDGTAFLAPWNITSTSPIRKVNVKKNQDKYRNRQYIQGGMDTTDPQTANFAGDGQTQTFVLAYPVALEPTIAVNGVQLTSSDIGIRGVDTGKQWYWNKNQNEISQDGQGTPLATTDKLTVTYQGYFPIMVVADNGGAISDRQTAEGGGTGLYEALISDQSLDTSDAALQAAQAMLQQYGRIATEITFETDTTGLAVGQLINIDLPNQGLNNTVCLIDQVQISDYTPAGDLRYQVHCVDGQALGSWGTFFTNVANQQGKYAIRDNEVLVKMKNASDVVKIGDSFQVSMAAPETRIGYAMIGYCEVS